MVLLVSSSHAGMVMQQDNFDMAQGGFNTPPAAFAAVLNLGNGEFCIMSTVSKPHLLPRTLEAAEEDDLNSNKQMQEAFNSTMSQYPLCTTKEQQERVERLAANSDEQQVVGKEQKIAINVPTFNIANPLGIFKTILFPENLTLFKKQGQALLSESDRSSGRRSASGHSNGQTFFKSSGSCFLGGGLLINGAYNLSSNKIAPIVAFLFFTEMAAGAVLISYCFL